MTGHYDNGVVMSYNMGSHDFGAGGDALAIKKPYWATRCAIESIHVAATETFTATTTPARIEIGTSTDSDKFAEVSLGTTANTDAFDITDPETELFDAGYGGNGVVEMGSAGENIDQLEVTYVAPTGGTPAGIGYVTIGIRWW